MQHKERKPKGYWTKDRCINDAKKYRYKKEWEKHSKSAFTIAHRNKWLNECCDHMIKIGNSHHRAIYAIEFSDHSVYIGLTHDLKERIEEHYRNPKSTVNRYIKKTNLLPVIKQLTDYLDKDSAIEKEEEQLIKYKNSNYKILNVAKTGALGGTKIIWTKDRCLEDAQQYSTRKEWCENSNTAYKKASKMKWLIECCAHMQRLKKEKMKYDLDTCKKLASKFLHRVRFKEAHSGAYSKIRKNKWEDQCYSHMIYLHKQ